MTYTWYTKITTMRFPQRRHFIRALTQLDSAFDSRNPGGSFAGLPWSKPDVRRIGRAGSHSSPLPPKTYWPTTCQKREKARQVFPPGPFLVKSAYQRNFMPN